MIQRIQSVYLLIASALCASTLLFPLLFFATSNNDLYDLYSAGLRSVGDNAVVEGSNYLIITSLLISILPFTTIFLYKRRMLQLRLCVVEIVLILGHYAMIAAYFYLSNRYLTGAIVVERGFHPAIFAPALAIVFALLATRSIFKDELLIRSVDRIR